MEAHELIDLEKRFWTGDADFYRQRTSPDCVMVFPGMGALDRDAAIAGIEGGSRWRDVEVSEPMLVEPKSQVAILTYSSRARRDGDDEPYRAYVSSVYVQDSGVWKLAFHQHTAAG